MTGTSAPTPSRREPVPTGDAAAHIVPAAIAALPGPTEEELRTLHAGLAERAEAQGILDVAYRTMDSPVGGLLLAATPGGLVRVAFAVEGEDAVLQALADRISPRVLESPRRLDVAARQLSGYFEGRRRDFDLALDWRLSTGFRRTVLAHLPLIAYGRTESYAQVAAATGRPAAVRAVGTACARNPLPIVVPCHRVVRSDGSLGGYLGGLPAKAALLALEARPA